MGSEKPGRWADKETRRQGDKETRRRGVLYLSPCLPLSLSPCLFFLPWPHLQARMQYPPMGASKWRNKQARGNTLTVDETGNHVATAQLS